LTKLILMYF